MNILTKYGSLQALNISVCINNVFAPSNELTHFNKLFCFYAKTFLDSHIDLIRNYGLLLEYRRYYTHLFKSQELKIIEIFNIHYKPNFILVLVKCTYLYYTYLSQLIRIILKTTYSNLAVYKYRQIH